MRSPRSSSRVALPLFLGVVGLLAVRCSDQGGTSQNATGAGTDPTAAAPPVNTAVLRPAGSLDTAVVDTAYWASKAIDKPYVAANGAQERAWATKDLTGIRTHLMSELTVVRARLNDGTRTDAAQAADQARAADLAQGLERVDRALAAIGASTDMTWAEMRHQQLHEVAEVHTWMKAHQEQDETAMTK